MQLLRKIPVLIACTGIVLATAVRLHAHTPFESSTIIRVHPEWLELAVKMSPASAEALLDHEIGQTISAPDCVAAFRSELKRLGLEMFSISASNKTLAVKRTDVEATDAGDVLFRLAIETNVRKTLRLRVAYLDHLGEGHAATLAVQDEAGRALLWTKLDRKQPWVVLDLPEMHARPPSAGFAEFVRLGIEHILTGYDHLFFLAGLLAVSRRFGPMLAIVSCFSLAHSLTLALAALRVVVLPERMVEASIAATIVVVGIENLLRREEPRARWAWAMGFGLIHGLGFASALRETGLGVEGVPIAWPLFGFNLGVELGQLAVVGLVLPILVLLWRRPRLARPVTAAISGVVVVFGIGWLIERLA